MKNTLNQNTVLMLNRVIVRYADSKCTDIYPDKTDRTYYVENRHLNNFLIAFIKLHHTPGINPHNNCETTKLSCAADAKVVPVSGIQSEIKSYERLRYLEQDIHKRSDCLAFSFARELIPSATAAYGRPVIDTHGEEGPRSITFEWQRMFWLFKSDGDEISVVINDNAKKTLTFFRKDFKSFIDHYTCVPAGLPVVENQSEFKSVAPVSVETVYAPGLVAKSMSYLGVQPQSESRMSWWTSPTLCKPEDVPYYEFDERPTIIYMSPFMHSEYIKKYIEDPSYYDAVEYCSNVREHVQCIERTETCTANIHPDFLEYFNQDEPLSYTVKQWHHEGNDNESEESDLNYEEIILDHSIRQRDTRCRNACVTLVLSMKRHNISKDCRSLIAKKVWQSHQNPVWE